MARAAVNNTTESCPYLDFSFDTGNYSFSALQLVYCSLTVPTSLAAIVGNLLVIVGIWGVSSENRPSNWVFIFVLALSDLGIGLISQPLFVLVSVVKIKNLANAFCGLSSKYLFISSYYFSTACSLTKTAMCLDRFIAIILHLRYKEFVTTKKKSVFLVSLWLVNVIPAIAGVLKDYYDALQLTVVIMLLVTSFIMCLLYPNAECIFRRRESQMEDPESSEDQQRNQALFNMTDYRASLLSARIVNSVFLLFSIPYMVTVTWLQVTDTDSLTFQCALWFSTTLFYFSSSVNPFVYLWFYDEVCDVAFGAVSKCFSTLHL